MSLEGKYNQVLLEELLVREIKSNNKVPNIDKLTAQLKELEAQKPLLGLRPMVSIFSQYEPSFSWDADQPDNHQISYYEHSSAAKWNNTLDNQKRDLKVMYDLTEEFTNRILEQTFRWNTYYENVRRNLEDLETRLDSMLLLKRDTLGYFEFVSDDFRDVEQVDLTSTTAIVDTGPGVVTLAEILSPGSPNQIPLDNVQLRYQTVQASGLASTAALPGMPLANCITDDTNGWWMQVIRSTNQGPVTGAVRVQFPETTSISKIRLSPAGSGGTAATTISILYSQNGVDYLLIPGDPAQVTTGNELIWTFPTVEARYVRFLFTKNGYIDVDANGNYVYEIGTKTISFYNPGFDVTTAGLLISKDLQSLDSAGTAKTFTKIALHVCENLPIDPNTGAGARISYFVSVDQGATYAHLDPIERENPTYPQIIDFSQAVPSNNINSPSTVYDSTIISEKLDINNESIDTPWFLELENNSDMAINFYIPFGVVSSVREQSYKIYRNAASLTTVTGTQVRGVPSGWSYDADNGTYSTIITVKDPDGLYIDFGTTNTLPYIDGVQVGAASGNSDITLSVGDHTFTTVAAAWAEVADGAVDVASLEVLDPLYPENHKLLIEGYDYNPSVWTGAENAIYVGGRFWSEIILTYDSQQNFDAQSSLAGVDLSVYTRKVDLLGNIAFAVKVSPESGDLENETFRIEYQLTDRTFDKIRLKAVLGTDHPSCTPVLDNYTIKLG